VPVKASKPNYKNSFNGDNKTNPYLSAIAAPPFDMCGINTRQNRMGGWFPNVIEWVSSNERE
jgi:hypothetical protein